MPSRIAAVLKNRGFPTKYIYFFHQRQKLMKLLRLSGKLNILWQQLVMVMLLGHACLLKTKHLQKTVFFGGALLFWPLVKIYVQPCSLCYR